MLKDFSIARDARILTPYVKAAMAIRPDLKLFASPWSPPTWMKRPRAYNHGRMRREKPVLDAYALYFAKFVRAYAVHGISVAQVHVQNEPENTWDYALYVASQVKHYFMNGAFRYMYWNMVLPKGGESTWGWKQNSLVTIDPETKAVVYQPEFYVMKHLTRFVAPGARSFNTLTWKP